MIYKLDGQDITNKAFKHNGYSYPRNWCQLASQEQLAALGITVEPDLEPEPETLEQIKARLIPAIDDLVASIYSRWTRFEAEYVLRESEAQAFKDGGYIGDAPRQVKAFADRAGVPYQQATDLILAQAANLRVSLANLGDLRMRKYEVLNAANAEAAQAKYYEIEAAIEQEAESI